MHTQLHTLDTLTHILCSPHTKGLAVTLAVTQEDPTGQCLLVHVGCGHQGVAYSSLTQIPVPLVHLATSCPTLGNLNPPKIP